MRIIIEYEEGKTPHVISEPTAEEPAVGEALDGGVAPDLEDGGMAEGTLLTTSEEVETLTVSPPTGIIDAGPAPDEIASAEDPGNGSSSGETNGELIDAGPAFGAFDLN